MLMITLLHVLLQGGILGAAKAESVNYWTAWAIETLSYGAVDIYAMISGYVGYRAKYRYSNIVELWLRVLFYSAGITLYFHYRIEETVSPKLLLSFFPVSTKQYWYFSAYFILFLFIPILNSAINNLEKKQLRAVLAVSVPMLTLLPLVYSKDVSGIGTGYCTLWLAVMYAAGAYIGKYGAFPKVKKLAALAGFLLFSAAAFFSKMLIHYNKPKMFNFELKEGMLISYVSPFIVAASVCLLLLFRGLKIPDVFKYPIAFAAPLTFSVYLIHVHPLIWDKYMSKAFAAFASASAPVMVLKIFAAAAGIFVVCILIDYFRQVIFNLLNIKGRLLKFEEKHIKVFSQESKTE